MCTLPCESAQPLADLLLFHRRIFRYALSPHATVIYFWTFYITVTFVLLNMFISIIMEAAEEVHCAACHLLTTPNFPATQHQVKDGLGNLRPPSLSSVETATVDEKALEP